MLIDTHCHLDVEAFDTDREQIIQQSIASGVKMMVVPSITPKSYVDVILLSQQYRACAYALGLHPMFVNQLSHSDIRELSNIVTKTLMVDNKLVAIGEIGLDYYVTKDNQEEQVYFFTEQLKIAQAYDLPVILHVRGAIDDTLKYLRRIKVKGGIAHAFNGSLQQAEMFIDLGFKLGFGGAMTHTRATKIRTLAKELPLASIVLETDAPDMPPAWLGNKVRNSPLELLKIAETLADMRRMSVSQIIEITGKNSQEVLPNLATLCTSLDVLH